MKDNLNTSQMSHSKRKTSFGIGSDAASSYYFSSVPKTPAVKSARKQQRLSSHVKQTSHRNHTIQMDENVDPQRDGDLSLLDVHSDDISSASTSMLLSPNDNHNDSTMSSACSDNLNKSVLSDTTELTASNYVFAAASRNKLEESMMEFKALQKMKMTAEQQEKTNVNGNNTDEADTEDIQTLLLLSKGEENSDSVDIDKLVDLSNDGSSDESLLHESIMSEDTNELKSRVTANQEAVKESEKGESFLSMNDSTVKDNNHNNATVVDSNAQQQEIEDANDNNQDIRQQEEIDSNDQHDSSDAVAPESKILDSSKDVFSNNVEDIDLSFRSSTIQSQLSSTPLIDISFSASRRRRMSSQSVQRPDSALKKHTQRIQSITESITKSRQYRESIRKSIARPRHSLPPSASFVGLSALEKMEQNSQMKNVDGDGLEATVKANNTTSALDTTFEQGGDKINDILGDLNNDVNESVEHVSPEKLDLSFDHNDSTVHERKEVTRILKSPLLNRAKTPALPNAERVFNPLAASPGRNTRSQVKKRKSMGESNIFQDLESSSKKPHVSATPLNNSSMQLDSKDSIQSKDSKDGRDDTQNFLDFIVPKLDVQTPKEDSIDLHVDSNGQDENIVPDPDPVVASNDHHHSVEVNNEVPETSQGSEETTLLLTSGSITSSNVQAPSDNVSPKSLSKRESSSTYRLINPSVSSMPSSVARLSVAAKSKSPFIPPTSTTKSKTLLVNSPLSGAEDDDDDFTVKSTLSFRSINSPASAGSNEEASAVSSASTNLEDRFKEDDDIADTIDLQNIMADFDGNFNKGSTKRKTDKKRRSSSRFSISSSSNTEDHSLVSRSLADTQDIQGLLNDETSRKFSLLPIQEVPTDSRHHIEKEQEYDEGGDSPDRESALNAAVSATPKSILKKKKSMTPKLNVAFRPPTAAEYNIGSPASKFTPMCDMKTRERFQVPTDESLLQNVQHVDSKKSEDTTLSSAGSFDKELSISKDNTTENGIHTIVLENNLGTMLEDVDTSKSVESNRNESTLSSYNVEYSSEDSECSILGGSVDASHTVGLESGMNEMLNDVDTTNRSCNDSLSSTENNTCTLSLKDSSINQKMEGESIVLEDDLKGVLERCENSCRLSVRPGITDFEDSGSFSVRESLCNDTSEGYTIPIESDLKVVLDMVNTSIDNTNTLSLPNASMMRPMEGDTIELDSDLRKLVGCIDESSMSKKVNSHINEDDTISLNDASIVQQSHGDTVELEADIQGLLRNNDPNHNTTAIDSISMPVKSASPCDNDAAIDQVEELLDPSCPNSLEVLSTARTSTNIGGNSSDLIESLERAVSRESSILEDTIELNSSPNLRRSQRRSSRRISLVPPSSDVTSSTGDYSGISALLQENISSIQSNHPTTPIQEENINIRWTEVSGLFSRLKEDDLFSDVSDVLIQEARALLSGYNHSEMADFLNEFFDNVCTELDSGADDTINDDALLSELINIPTDILRHIQSSIRGVSTHTAFNDFKNKLQLLESTSFEVVNNEFVKWETLVANALCSRIDEMKHDIDEDENEIVRRLGLSDNIQESLNILSQHAIRNARLEEIRKYKSNADTIEKEIKLLEDNIKEAENELSMYHDQHLKVDTVLSLLDRKRSILPDLADNKSFAERNFQKMQSLEGLHSWKIQELSESRIRICFEGYVEQLNLSLDFVACETESILVKAHGIEPFTAVASAVYISGNRLTTNVLSFFAFKVNQLANSLNERILEDKSDISSVVQEVESFLCRMEIIGKEISRLELRHSGRFHLTDRGYELSLSIFNRFLSTKIYSHFLVTDAYPFAIMDVDIEGNVDIDKLGHQLAKSAYPGYGYLTRTCDMIAVFQKSN